MTEINFLDPPDEPQTLSARDEIEIAIGEMKRAYCAHFGADTPYRKMMLDDLGRFCRADDTTFRTDAREHALLEGRREVYLRIMNFLEKSEDELLTAILRGRKQGEWNDR